MANEYRITLSVECEVFKNAHDRIRLPLVIAFIGYNERLTRQFFEEFAWDNREQIASADYIRGRVKLHDGTQIVRIDAGKAGRDGYRFDQIIVADDRRRNAYSNRRLEIMCLEHQCACSLVPKEFRFQFYDVDEERR